MLREQRRLLGCSRARVNGMRYGSSFAMLGKAGTSHRKPQMTEISPTVAMNSLKIIEGHYANAAM